MEHPEKYRGGRHGRGTDAQSRYVADTYRELVVRAPRMHGRHHDNDDVVQRCAERLLRHLDRYRAQYPSPAALAASLLRTGGEDHRRAERAQRGEGARVFVGADGLRSPGRLAVPLIGIDPAVAATDHDRVEDRVDLRRLLEQLPERIRALLWLVRVEGREVGEAASLLGWSRSHASRQLSKVEQRWRHDGCAR